MASYLITYKKKHGRETRLVEMPSLPKLLLWIVKNGSRCCCVSIRMVEEINYAHSRSD